MTKICTKCGEAKPLERFGKNASCRGGIATRCKDCDNEYLRSYYRKNVKKRMLISAKDRAAKAGVPFDLTEEDFTLPEKCPALGVPLAPSSGQGGRETSPNLDRIVPHLGYVKGNVIVISGKANRIKSNGNFEEILSVGHWLKNLLTSEDK